MGFTKPGIIKLTDETTEFGVNWKSFTAPNGFDVSITPVPKNGETYPLHVSADSVSFSGLTPGTEYTVTIVQTGETAGQTIKHTTAGTLAIQTPVPVDTIKPVITLIGNASEVINVGTSYTDAGATASDNKDGVITANIVTTNDYVDAVGTYTFHYNVTDQTGNKADEVIRSIEVKAIPDIIKPIITITGGNETLTLGDLFTDKGAIATDNKDGDITASIITNSNVDASKVGDYTITYNVTDQAGNKAQEQIRTVRINPVTGKASFTLSGLNPISIEENTSYIEPGVQNIIKDDATNGVAADVDITGTVDTKIAGTYTITYTYTTAKSGSANEIQKTRKVIVKAKALPDPSIRKWLDGDELDYKTVIGSEYDKAVDLAITIETPIDEHPENRVAVFYDAGAMDPYERRIVANENNEKY